MRPASPAGDPLPSYASRTGRAPARETAGGTIEWQYAASGYLTISAVVDGVIYASSSDIDSTNPGHNKIYALKATDGSLIWRYDAPTMFFAPVVG